ncbi:tipN [Brevundimonas sp. Leaf363]|uniref:hypothetical protein n=1 Tax=Brevundimonas sp. Leaf363 TaxID=1736353 RepID=UPI0006F51458|nr:hypothetical protein [Brevundimonas sp. Leaf363]KQS54309.1 tipN [Brevundimonas sp. Leaf363]
MKSRVRTSSRSTRSTTDGPVVEPVFETTQDAASPDTSIEPIADPSPDLAAEDATGPRDDRPFMSERRRRRMQAEAEMAMAIARPPVAVDVDPEPDLDAQSLAHVEPEPAPAPTPLALPPAPQARYAYAVAGVAVALWVGGVASWAAFEAGSGQAALEPLRLAVYALIALAPAGLALVLAHAVRQGAGLAAETRHARSLAEALVAPTALAAQQSGAILNTLRGDIDQALLTAERARNDMALLREALAQETNRLNEAADTATRTARRLTEQLGQERELMTGLSGDMERQAAGVLDAVERQSRMVVDASDLAQTQLREAEAALAARAADMAAAAVEAQDAARIAADDLSRQTLRLENAGTGVADQIQSVEEGLGQQRAALVTAAYALRTDQEDFSAQVESQRAQLIEQLSASRAGASELGQTSQRSAESLKELVEAASDQFRALVDMSQREADSFDNATKEALDRFEALAADARDGLVEETRRALATLEATAIQARTQAEEATEHAQLRTDRLGEALFDAAQKADAAAEARIAGARRLVHETTGLVDEAGSRAEQRLENLADQLAGALARIESAIADVDQRAALLPREAEARVQAVRDTVEAGLEALSAASRKAAEDTEALDAGFQERVRRNYDMLTEAVRLMGVVSGDNAPVRRREPAAPMPEGDRGAGLRGRLRLSPVDAPRQAAPSEPMDWNDLAGAPSEPTIIPDLSPPPRPSAQDASSNADRVAAAIRRMGVDPNALLPRARVQEAAQAIAAGDLDTARQIVRRVAPAAVRSVSRRVLSDVELKADVEAYVRSTAVHLRSLIGDTGAVLDSLSSDGGRAYLLLDAAVGDLG